jgi:hypothetical protein
MQEPTRVQVSLPALMARINRKLAPASEQLKAARGARARFDLGEYYVLDYARNFVMAFRVDPEDFGRELGVLKDWEALEGSQEEQPVKKGGKATKK